MADKLAHDREMIAHGLVFNFGAKVAQASAFSRRRDGTVERTFGGAQQLLDSIVNNSNRDRLGCVPHPALLNHTNVELHDVAVLNAALTGNAGPPLVV